MCYLITILSDVSGIHFGVLFSFNTLGVWDVQNLF
jgi:hypothetical protein